MKNIIFSAIILVLSIFLLTTICNGNVDTEMDNIKLFSIQSPTNIFNQVSKRYFVSNGIFEKTLLKIDDNKRIDLYKIPSPYVNEYLKSIDSILTHRTRDVFSIVLKENNKYTIIESLIESLNEMHKTYDTVNIMDFAVNKELDNYIFISIEDSQIKYFNLDFYDYKKSYADNIFLIISNETVNAELLTPNIVRVSHADGFIAHYIIETKYKKDNEKYFVTKTIWWNKKGNKMNIISPYELGSGVYKREYSTDPTEPVYDENVWDDWYKMNKVEP